MEAIPEDEGEYTLILPDNTETSATVTIKGMEFMVIEGEYTLILPDNTETSATVTIKGNEFIVIEGEYTLILPDNTERLQLLLSKVKKELII